MDRKRLRIMYVHHGTVEGGAPFSMLYTAQIAKENGYEVAVLLLKPSPELAAIYSKEGFEVLELPGLVQCYYYSCAPMSWKRPGTYKQLAKILVGWKESKRRFKAFLKAHPCDIVHLNSVVLVNLATALQELGQKHVWHVREFGPPLNDFRTAFFRKRLVASQEVIFLSAAEQKSWIGDESHGTVVHNFVPDDRFQASVDGQKLRDELKIKPKTQMILFVGGIREHKGGYHFLRALQQVATQHPEYPFHAVLPGALPESQEAASKLNQEIASLGLAGKCTLLPFQTGVDQFFAASDLVVFPSRQPHFARPVVEAAAMGKAVVISNLPPMTEFVSHGRNGFIARPDDDQDLAEKIVTAISNPERMNEMGATLRDDFRERFARATQAKRILSIYQRLFPMDDQVTS